MTQDRCSDRFEAVFCLSLVKSTQGMSERTCMVEIDLAPLLSHVRVEIIYIKSLMYSPLQVQFSYLLKE